MGGGVGMLGGDGNYYVIVKIGSSDNRLSKGRKRIMPHLYIWDLMYCM